MPPTVSDEGSLLIPVDSSKLPPPVDGLQIGSFHLRPKAEYHMTIWGFPMRKMVREEILGFPAYREIINNLLSCTSWDFDIQDYYLLRRENKKASKAIESVTASVVVMVSCPGMQWFRQGVSLLFANRPECQQIAEWARSEAPPAHITLYATDKYGIGINTAADWRNSTEKLAIPIPDHGERMKMAYTPDAKFISSHIPSWLIEEDPRFHGEPSCPDES